MIHPFHFQKRNQLFMRVHKRNSSLACQAIALKDSHLSLVTSGHFLIETRSLPVHSLLPSSLYLLCRSSLRSILPSAFFLSVPTIVGWLLKQLMRILLGPVIEWIINRSTERIS